MFKLDREFYIGLEYYQDSQMKTSHFPNLDSEWLDPVSLNTIGVGARGGASDVNAAPGVASPTPLQRLSRLNINAACR